VSLRTVESDRGALVAFSVSLAPCYLSLIAAEFRRATGEDSRSHKRENFLEGGATILAEC